MRQDANDRPERWELSDALDRLAQATLAPPSDPRRGQALLAAFDAAHAGRAAVSPPNAQSPTPKCPTPKGSRMRAFGWLGGLAAAAVLFIAAGIRPGRVVAPAPGLVEQPLLAGEFIPWPGASALPPLESGELVRMQLPVTMLPSLGVAPPASHVTAVTADVVVGQDGLARAVRFVTD